MENSAETKDTVQDNIKLITLDPGHFHAALVQKSMPGGVSPMVHVYAPVGPDVKGHLNLIEKYNIRPENPTAWEEKVYTGPDYLEKMLQEKAGNVVVLAGNNQKKTAYIKKSVEAGLHVLADKPMAISQKDFNLLREAFAEAEKNKVLLYDIMTERYEITNILQKELSRLPEVFGQLEKGTFENPAITKESVHHYYKIVSGAPLVRPSWFFDVSQAGSGLVDVTTHLVDLIQWECFPEQVIDYNKEINMISARQWPTKITIDQFKQVTKQDAFPSYLTKDIKNNVLEANSNGEMHYTIRGTHAKVSVLWNFEAPEGAGDTHFSIMRGTKANLIIRQGKEQQYKPTLYIEKTAGNTEAGYETLVQNNLNQLAQKFPGVNLQKNAKGWEVIIPEQYKVGHEAHFGQVTEKYLEFLKAGKLPAWEVPNMIAKYFTTTTALEKAK
nr:putative oxidoreductase C-terminal domain-containing protein [Adhaeribacter aquaticus]